jgi:hypothetical protein
MITFIVLVLVGFFLASLVVPLFIGDGGGYPEALLADGRGRLESSWTGSTVIDPRDLAR